MKPGKIRPLAICVFRHENRIFAAEGYDQIKQQTFYRPLGGKIEFGEYGHQTIARELDEEIQQAVKDIRYLGALENIFTFNGQQGHEIVLIYDGAFVDQSMYTRESINGRDDDELLFVAYWKPLDFFQRGEAPLYPDGLVDLLLKDRPV
jgi:8-oxo-dGTP pyrophosphatase MutT (NUDIX family)